MELIYWYVTNLRWFFLLIKNPRPDTNFIDIRSTINNPSQGKDRRWHYHSEGSIHYDNNIIIHYQEFVPTSSIYLPTWPHLSTRVSYPYNTLQLHSLFKDEILCVLLRSRIFWMANHVKVHADRWEIFLKKMRAWWRWLVRWIWRGPGIEGQWSLSGG